MQQFVIENPGAALAIGGILCSGCVALGALAWQLMRDGARTTEGRLTQAIHDLRETMREALARLDETVRRIDDRHITLTDDLDNRLCDLDRRLTALRGEHDNRGDHCPGAMALNKILADGGFHHHRRDNDG